MNLPKLRLRQVQEHSSHFKVKRGGQEIKIAKKALSPKMIGRLRAFAMGGEVTNRQVGGEIPEAELTPEQLDERLKGVSRAADEALRRPASTETPESLDAKADEAVRKQAEEFVKTRLRRSRTVTGTGGIPLAEETPEQAADRMRQELANAPAPAAPAPASAPPAPVSVVVNTAPSSAPAPAGEVQAAAHRALTVASAPATQPTPAPAPAPAPTPLAPVAQAVPSMQLEPVSLGGSPGFQPARPIVPPLDLEPSQGLQMGEQFAAPAAVESALAGMTPLAAAATRAVAPAAPTAPAPVAPVVAPAAVTPIVPALAFQPVEPPAMPTAETVRAAVEAAPPGTPVSTVVQSLMPGIVIPPLEIARIDALPPPTQNIKLFDRGVERAIRGAVEQAQVDYQAAADEIRIAEESVKRKAEIEEQARQDLASLQSSAAEMRKAAEAGENLQSFGASVGWGNAIGSLFALMAGGFASGYAGIPNYAMAAFDKAMDRDLAEQRRRRDSLWNRYKDALGDTEDAKKLWQASMADLAAGRMKLMAAQTNLGRVSPAMQKAIADIEMRAAQLRDDVVRGDAAARFAAEEAESEVELKQARAKAALKPRATAAAANLAFRTRKYEVGRTMNVGGVPVQRVTEQGATGVQENINNRNFAVSSLEEIVNLFEKHGEKAWDILAKERGEMIGRLGLVIENSPQSFGYKRAVSVNAGTILKASTQDPAGIKAGIIELLGDRPRETGLKVLLDETKRSRREYIEGQASPIGQRDKEAAKYGLWKLESQEALQLGKKPPPLPKLSLSTAELEQIPYMKTQAAAAPPVVAPVVAPAGAPSAGGDVRSRMRRVSAP